MGPDLPIRRDCLVHDADLTHGPAFRNLVARATAGMDRGPTLAVHYAAIFLPDPVNLGFWDGRDHVIPADGIHFVQLEGGVRGRFLLADSWSVDPAISLGYCRTFSSSPDARDSGMTVNIAAALRWRRPRYQLVATLGLMMQAYGGVEGIAWVRSYPVVYTAIGAGF